MRRLAAFFACFPSLAITIRRAPSCGGAAHAAPPPSPRRVAPATRARPPARPPPPPRPRLGAPRPRRPPHPRGPTVINPPSPAPEFLPGPVYTKPILVHATNAPPPTTHSGVLACQRKTQGLTTPY